MLTVAILFRVVRNKFLHSSSERFKRRNVHFSYFKFFTFPLHYHLLKANTNMWEHRTAPHIIRLPRTSFSYVINNVKGDVNVSQPLCIPSVQKVSL